MSLASGIHDFLSDELSVGARVYPLTLPQGVVLKALTYQVISDDQLVTHSDQQEHPTYTGERYERTRVQFGCYGNTYLDAEALKNELKTVAVGYRGWWGDVWVEAVLPVLTLDDYEPDTKRYRFIQDLEVHHKAEPAGS